MNIPNIPTDNIFKFFFITASLILIIGYLYPNYEMYKIEKQRILINKEISILHLERKIVGEEMKRFEKKVKAKNPNFDFIVGDSLIYFSAPVSGAVYTKAEQQLLDDIQSRIALYTMQNNESDRKIIEINNKKELLDAEVEELELYGKIGLVAMIASTFLMIFGLIFWFNEETAKYRITQYQCRKITKDKGICQSCGMDINNDANISDTFAKYCSFCCKENHFNHDMTFDEFSELVKNRLSELKWSKRKIAKHITAMKKLNRWNNDFRWS